jgi:very-short-patch-repair endonuclease
MSAIIQPISNGKQRTIDFRRISQKRMDYAVYDRQFTPVAVVELDDETHDAARGAVRDAYLASAGIRTIRFQFKAKPNENGIRSARFLPRRASTQVKVPLCFLGSDAAAGSLTSRWCR